MNYEKYELIKERHTNEDTALTVEDYPYGFRLRTKIRYWLETTKNGVRFVSQTLNPKTNLWNTPKKSTYCELGFMVYEKTTHYVSWIGFGIMYSDEEEFNDFMEFIKDVELSDYEKNKIKEFKAVIETRKFIKVSVRTRKHKNRITGEIKTSLGVFELSDYDEVDDNGNLINEDEEKKEQEKVKRKIGIIYKYNLKKENDKNE